MDLSVLVVGRGGNGKSATGNSILGKRYFNLSFNSSSIGVDIKQFSDTVDGRKVIVTEISGFEYPGMDYTGDIEDTLRKIEDRIKECTNGFHAVIIVLMYGTRFTKQEKDAVLMIKHIFGPSVIKDFGIIVMTYGDSFDLDAEVDNQTFEDWCRAQTGDARTLFDECSNRCVLFNNRTKIQEKMDAQRQQLFSMVTSIAHPYTLNEYKNAAKSQTEILVRSKLPTFEKHKNTVMEEVWKELDRIDQEYSMESCDILELSFSLNIVQENLVALKQYLQEEDRDTGVLNHLLSGISVAGMQIQTKLKTAEQRHQVSASSQKPATGFVDAAKFTLQVSHGTMDLSVLVVGKDGNGKSATGNSILGKRYFNLSLNSSSVGVDIKQFSDTVDGRKVIVTEISGFEYPGWDYTGDIEDTLRKIETPIKESTNGFDAVIIVLKYGVRFNKQEKDALLMIKHIFGTSVVKDFGIIVMTNGDSFDSDMEEDKQTFEDWHRAQTGDARTLFDECNNRCVLFNNRTKIPEKMNAQRQQLFSLVTSIAHPYTLNEYKNAAKSQREILVRSKLSTFEKLKDTVMTEVWKELGRIDQECSVESSDILELSSSLNIIQEKLVALKQYLQKEDKDTGVLNQLLYDIPVAERKIQAKMKTVEQRHQVSPSSAKPATSFADAAEFTLQVSHGTMDLSVLVVGRDGNGKSATGNSILGKRFFTSSSNSSSTKVRTEQFSDTVGNRKVTVTEISGLEYPGKDSTGDIEDILRKIEIPIKESTNGFHAVIIVLKYGTRFTKQEKDALLMIKHIFGPSVVKDFGIIVMTYGDSFDLDMEEDNQTFENWCWAQTGDARTLFDECNNRCVLFNNRTKIPEKMDTQRQQLFSMVTSIAHPYTLDEYKNAAKSRTEILVQSKLSTFEKLKNTEMEEVWKELGRIDQEYSMESCDILELSFSLNIVQEKLVALKQYLQKEDRDTGVLNQLLYDIPVAEMKIQTKLKTAEQRLQVSTSSEKWVICFEDAAEFTLQSITETVSIREPYGNYTSDSRNLNKDVSGSGTVLLEICKTISKTSAQQVPETYALLDNPKDREQVTEVLGHEKPNGDLANTKVIFGTIGDILEPYKFNDVMCIILKYGLRLTKQEIDVVMKMITFKYGVSKAKNHSILILACDVDNLEMEKDRMFEDWCKEETGMNQHLLDKCGNRCVLLNPWTKDGRKLTAQKLRLLSLVRPLAKRLTGAPQHHVAERLTGAPQHHVAERLTGAPQRHVASSHSGNASKNAEGDQMTAKGFFSKWKPW